MTRKGKVEREKRILKVIERCSERRAQLKREIISAESIEEKTALIRRLDCMKRDGSATRYRKRCLYTGRPRGIETKFTGACALVARKKIDNGEVPGVKRL